MYGPIVHRAPVFSKSVRILEHHKVLTLLALFAILVIVVASASQETLMNQSLTVGAVSGPSKMVTALTRLDDPQFAHEYSGLTQGIHHRLDILRVQTRADRAYLMTYSHGVSPVSKWNETYISSTFEVGKYGVMPQMYEFQDMARREWLQIKWDESGMLGGFFPTARTGVGLELYDAFGIPIGYLGLHYLRGTPRFQNGEMKRLRQTADAMKVNLLQPLEYWRG